MKIFNMFKKDQSQSEFADETVNSSVTELENNEEIDTGTKVKVIAALMIVGFATYVAYWVQSPVTNEFRADVLNQSQQSEENNQSQNTEESGFTQQIAISDFDFSPAKINVEKGTTVVWTNKDSVSHTITGQNFSSPTLNSGDTFSYKFNDDSSVNYHCTFHKDMLGIITVGSGSETTQATTQAATQATIQTSAESQTEQLHDSAVESSPVLDSQLIAEAPTLSEPTAEQSAMSMDSMDVSSIDTNNHPAAYTEDLGVLEQQAMESQKQLEDAQKSAETSANLTALETQQLKYKGKIAQSGPEDLLYFVAFGGILYLNRKKFLSAWR